MRRLVPCAPSKTAQINELLLLPILLSNGRFKSCFFRDYCGQVVHHEGHEEHEEKMIGSRQDAKNAKLGILFSFGAFASLRELLRSRLPRSSARIFVLKADEGVGQAIHTKP